VSHIFVEVYVDVTDLPSRVCDKFCRMQIVRVGACRTGVTVPAWAGAQWLREVQTHVHSIAHLQHFVVIHKLYIRTLTGRICVQLKEWVFVARIWILCSKGK
jgi:hypothetical protein